MTILLHVLVAALYAATAWARWPRSVPASAERRRLAEALLAVALVLHAVAIWQAIVRPDGLDLSFVNALSLVAGLAVLAAWLSGVMRALPAVAA
ncbi:MAG TPA: cytochrome C biogenesis protein, partial [Casimicrobiaceae bacterium]